MKMSVSLPEEDVRFLDRAVALGEAPSRSAALHKAIELLRTASLEDTYEAAFAEWNTSADEGLWEATAGDGVTDAPR